jgi:hypothetical protein
VEEAGRRPGAQVDHRGGDQNQVHHRRHQQQGQTQPWPAQQVPGCQPGEHERPEGDLAG